MTTPLRILIADDHAILRAGLRLLIDSQVDMTVRDEAADGREAVQKTHRVHPDVVVLDLTMPRADPRLVIAEIVRTGARVVVLTMHDDQAYVDEALAAGASGYVVKTAVDIELLAAIRAVARGRIFVDATPRRGARPRGAGRRARAGLSPREQRVVCLVAHGHTNREIAQRLGVSVKTVETFRARACDKLGLQTRADLVAYAMRMRLVDPQGSGPDSTPRRAR